MIMPIKVKQHLIKKVVERTEGIVGRKYKEILEENKQLKEENEKLKELNKDMMEELIKGVRDDIQRLKKSLFCR